MKVIVLCGGRGENLWPISRKNLPKQFSKIIFERSLFQETLLRFSKFVPWEDIFLVFPDEYKFFVRSQVVEVFGSRRANEIIEPKPRGAFLAVVFSLISLIKNEVDENEVLVFVNSDQVWRGDYTGKLEKFFNLIRDFYFDKVLCTVSSSVIKVRDYVRLGKRFEDEFFEFEEFDKSSNLGNLGIYVVRFKDLVKMLQKTFDMSLEALYESSDYEGQSFEMFVGKVKRDVLVYDLAVEVLDIDSVSDIANVVKSDDKGNRLSGDVVVDNTENSLIVSTKRLIAVNGVSGINVIETPDVVYVSSNSIDNKNVLKLLEGREELDTGVTSYRPWGSYTVIDRGPNYQIKKIIVNPGESLSLQLHYHRSEHWVVVRGTAKVTVDDKVLFLKENESTFIPKTAKHRLENPGKIPLEIIEIQIGEYISEDDIVRFSDVYGR
jgi:mannose-1-phosphate guanylyltransferase/mannose-6-phosphate isomerase